MTGKCYVEKEKYLPGFEPLTYRPSRRLLYQLDNIIQWCYTKMWSALTNFVNFGPKIDKTSNSTRVNKRLQGSSQRFLIEL